MAIKFSRNKTDSSVPKDISTTSSTSKLQISSGSTIRSQHSVRNSTQKDTPKKTTEELSKDVENGMRQEVRKHRDASVRAPSPDTSDESSIFSSVYSSDDASFANEDFNGCRATGGGCGGLDNGSVNVGSFDLFTNYSYSSSDSDSEVSSAPGMLGCVAEFAKDMMLRNHSPFDDVGSETTDIVDITPARGERPKQLDIYAKSPGSWRIRLYSKMPRPERTDHILVKVHASTVSMQDCLETDSGDREHRVPGRQVMGEVHSVGRKVKKISKIRQGDRIVALTPYGKGNARYISIPVKSAIFLPSDIKRDEVICLVESYMSAYQMLNLGKRDGLPLTNQKILIIGGSDPVGQALVEMALKEGAIVHATSARAHRQHLETMGATWLPNNPKRLSKLRGKMDVVIDTLCLDGYKASYEALNHSGKLICTTNPCLRRDEDASIFQKMDRWWSTLNARYIWANINRSVTFYDVHQSFADDPDMFERELGYLLCKLRNEEIKPKISGRISLSQVPKAQTRIEKGRLPNGTLVVLPWKILDTTQDVQVERVR